MAEIKPIQFPRLNQDSAQPTRRPQPVKKDVKVAQSPLHQLFANAAKTKGSIAQKSSVQSTSTVSSQASMDTRLLTQKFYKPQATVKAAAPLGQIIDVKV